MPMVLVNQNYRFLAIWLQSSLYNTKMEDLVTIGNKLLFWIFIHRSFTHTHSIGRFDPIQKNYASRLHNPVFIQFRIDLWVQIARTYILPQICYWEKKD